MKKLLIALFALAALLSLTACEEEIAESVGKHLSNMSVTIVTGDSTNSTTPTEDPTPVDPDKTETPADPDKTQKPDDTQTTPVQPQPHTHSYTSVITKAATCTTDGVTTYTCSGCADSYTKPITKLGHNYTTKVTAATCTADGVTTYTCSGCADSYTKPITKLGHNYTTKVTAATCAAQGYTTHTCSRCSDSYKDTYTNKTSHNTTSTITRQPTCTVDGVTTTKCKNCSYQTTSAIKATGHYTTTTVTTKATCTTTGVQTVACSRCSYKTTETIAKLGHDYENFVTRPTCTTGGYTTHTCYRCKNSYVDSYTNTVDHKFSASLSGGQVIAACSSCSKSFNFERDEIYVMPLEAKWESNGELSVKCVIVNAKATSVTNLKPTKLTYYNGSNKEVASGGFNVLSGLTMKGYTCKIWTFTFGTDCIKSAGASLSGSGRMTASINYSAG